MPVPEQQARTRVLIVGAGEAGRLLAQQMRREPELSREPLGFVDDDPALIGTEVLGLPVVDRIDGLVQAAGQLAAQEILIAIPSAGGALIRRLVLLCKRAGLPFRIVPGLRAIIDGDVRFNQVRPVAPEDLLGRESVRFRADAARAVVQGASVLVTGAGAPSVASSAASSWPSSRPSCCCWGGARTASSRSSANSRAVTRRPRWCPSSPTSAMPNACGSSPAVISHG